MLSCVFDNPLPVLPVGDGPRPPAGDALPVAAGRRGLERGAAALLLQTLRQQVRELLRLVDDEVEVLVERLLPLRLELQSHLKSGKISDVVLFY